MLEQTHDVRIINKDYALWKKGFVQIPCGAFDEIDHICSDAHNKKAARDIVYNALFPLCQHNNIVTASPTAIAEKSGVRRADVYTVLKHLERKEFIYKTTVGELREFQKSKTSKGGVKSPSVNVMESYLSSSSFDKLPHSISILPDDYPIYIISQQYFSRGNVPEIPAQYQKRNYEKQSQLNWIDQAREQSTLYTQNLSRAKSRFEKIIVPTVDDYEQNGLIAFVPDDQRSGVDVSDSDTISDLYSVINAKLGAMADSGDNYAQNLLNRL